MAGEQLPQRLHVDFEWRVFADLTLDDLDDLGSNVFAFVPVLLKPWLQLGNIAGGPDWMFSSMFWVSPGTVKLLEPTKATEPITWTRGWVM